jgi:hypothetical protein
MNRSASVLLVGVLGLAGCADQGPAGVTGVPAGLTPPSRALGAAENREYVAGQIIVRFRPGAARSEIARRTGAARRTTCGSSAW